MSDMLSYNSNAGDLDAVKSDGAATARNADTGQITLSSATTYYVPLSGDMRDTILTPAHTALVAVHIQWSAAIVLTVTLETCNFPHYRYGQQITGINPTTIAPPPVDVSNVDTTAGNWLQEFLSSTNVPITGGAVASNAITSTPAAGGAMIHIGNLGSKRARLKLVVGGTGGTVRVNKRGKQGV